MGAWCEGSRNPRALAAGFGLSAFSKMGTSITVRRVRPDDETFLLRLFANTHEREWALLPLGEDRKRLLVRSQFLARRRHYAEHYPDTEYQVIERDGLPAGSLYVQRSVHEILVVDIALLREHRGAGIGGALLQQLQLEAAATRRPIRFRTEQINVGMIGLARRLGFRMAGADGPHYRWEWSAADDARAAGSAREWKDGEPC